MLLRKKASGIDGISNGDLRAAPVALAKHLHPLLVKVAWGSGEPAQHQGGLAAELFKGAGSPHCMDGYRSIMLGSHLAKHHHAFLRSRVLKIAGTLLRSTQFGGIPGRGGDIASLLLHSHMDLWRSRGRTSVYLYLDVKSAYYTLVRELVLPTGACSDRIDGLLARLADHPSTQAGFRALLLGPPLLDPQVYNAHLIDIITDTFRGAWFAMEGSGDIAVARKGTRPGMVLADLLYSIALAPILAKAQDAWRSVGAVEDLDSYSGPFVQAVSGATGEGDGNPTAAVCDNTFADDIVL